MQTLELTLGLHSEIWESQENKTHQNKIKEALEMAGVQYISNPRPDRKGGGAAITLISGEFTLTKIDVLVPKNLEVVWGLVKPKVPTPDFKVILVCSFYSAPNSRRKTQLVNHISIKYSELRVKYKNCYFLAGGDKNELNIKHILDISPSLHSHNTKPTLGVKNIDVLISDMSPLYNEPVITKNVPTDIPDGRPGGGKTSDHPIVYARPRLERGVKSTKQMVVKKTRRLDEDRKRKLAEWIQHESWEELYDSQGMAEKFSEMVFRKLDDICPEESIKITKFDGKVKSLALQKLGRMKLREYSKHGFSSRFKDLKRKMKERVKFEGKKALDKLLEDAGEKSNKWMREVNRISARPREDRSSTFSVQSHIDASLTPLQSAEKFVAYFSKISQEYTPIEEDSSAPWMDVQEKLKNAPCCHPTVEEHEVFKNMTHAKKTDSVQGDFP